MCLPTPLPPISSMLLLGLGSMTVTARRPSDVHRNILRVWNVSLPLAGKLALPTLVKH